MPGEVFNFKDTIASVNGIILTGYMDGTPIESERNESMVSQHVGADGTVSYNESNDETGTFTFTLKQDSSSAPLMDALLKSRKAFDVLVQDVKRNKKISGENCHFEGLPQFKRGAEIDGVEYKILAAHYKED